MFTLCNDYIQDGTLFIQQELFIYIKNVSLLHSVVYRNLNGGLFRALTNFTPVLPVNNTLIHRIRPASSWPRDSL